MSDGSSSQMPVEFKICGLTRAVDSARAVEAGAAFVGVIFAGGPRALTPQRAADVLVEMPVASRRVGVFGSASASEIARIAELAGIGVAQLHNDPDAATVAEVRERTGLDVWAVVRVSPGDTVPDLSELFSVSSGLLLDARSPSGLGGTGTQLPWNTIGPSLTAMRPAGSRLVLAGGLTALNVGEAIAAIRPDVVDVSSGVELEPGIKDPAQLRAFADALGTARIRIP